MYDLSSGISQYVSDLGPDASSALKRARNREHYRNAVAATWRTNPQAAFLVLKHTNSIYFAKDERPRIGADKDQDRWVFGMYFDNATVRTEVDFQQAELAYHLRHEGLAFDQLAILSARGGMKERHLFPELLQDGASSADLAALQTQVDAPAVERSEITQARMREKLKVAFCLAVGDIELAWALLEKIREVRFSAAGKKSEERRQSRTWLWCTLYVDHRETFAPIMAQYGAVIRDRARDLGLYLRGIYVKEASQNMLNTRAFARVGSQDAAIPDPDRK